MTEYERRRRAVELRTDGKRPCDIAKQLGRSRAWVYATLTRHKAGGNDALRDRSRAPRHRPRATSPAMVSRILTIRQALEHRGRGKRFCGVGADAISWELHLSGCKDIPANRTIARIVARSGLSKTTRPRRPRSDPRPFPAPPARRPGDVHQSDVVGPRHIATRSGPLRFFSYHTVDVAGGGIACWQSPERGADAYCRYLVERAWSRLGVPRVWQVDNEMVLAGFPGRIAAFTAPVRLALLLGAEVVFIPQGEPGRQANIESFNALWQQRVLRRFSFVTLSALRRTSQRFESWFMQRRPHPQLRASTHGTAYPGALLASLDGQLRHLPTTFSLDDYRGSDGRLRVPLSRGRITWIRLVAEDGAINISNESWFVGRRYANQYVTATLSTARRTLTIKLAGRVIKQHPFKLNEPVVQPLIPR